MRCAESYREILADGRRGGPSARCTLRGLAEDPHRRRRGRSRSTKVEPAKEIVRRFLHGAMSLGSISTGGHETLAIAMNRLGGRSNTGEGGEDRGASSPTPTATCAARAIEAGRVRALRRDVHYLVNADQLQIKMAQGAKVARAASCPATRSTATSLGAPHAPTARRGLISPPPHHDIYSIEDLNS